MKNKRFLWGMLIMALIFAMTVSGCEDSVQIVAFATADSVDRVWVSFMPSAGAGGSPNQGHIDFVNIGCDPIKNGISYDVYVQVRGNKGIRKIGSADYRSYREDAESVSFSIDSASLLSITNIGWNGNSAMMRFGVSATDANPNHVASKIVWSEYVMITYIPFNP
jgi:hypothetical protein